MPGYYLHQCIAYYIYGHGSKTRLHVKAGVRCSLIITTVSEQHPRPHSMGAAPCKRTGSKAGFELATNSIWSYVLCQLGYNMWHKCSLHGTLLYNMLSSDSSMLCYKMYYTTCTLLYHMLDSMLSFWIQYEQLSQTRSYLHNINPKILYHEKKSCRSDLHNLIPKILYHEKKVEFFGF